MSAVFEAAWAGRCGVCDGRFSADDRVTYIDDELSHATCPTPVIFAEPCPQCYMVPATNGTCGCES